MKTANNFLVGSNVFFRGYFEDFKSKDGSKNNFNSNSNGSGNGNKPFKKKPVDRNYMNSYNKDKDEDDNVRPQRKQTPKDNKAKEQQPDKIEIMNRIEKEKKAIQKKQAENRKNNKTSQQNKKNIILFIFRRK